jgi:hypothetical protein
VNPSVVPAEPHMPAPGSVDGLLAFAMRESSAARLRRQALIALLIRRGAIRGAK